ncbi:acyltransferase domain-containing protein, partial [Micromonospora sp. NPDC023633]|uniref:acyltransferase domain-containing protein n=1 Tax=Micromonospora sp. NPDC023633 TaxID=3154320 RepID=UPI0033E66DA1
MTSADNLHRWARELAPAAGTATTDPKVVYVFPGQGSQWAGMALDLIDRSPEFAAAMDRCAVALRPYTDWDLLATLRGDDSWLSRDDVVQPALFAVMIALADLLRHYGVEPDAVIGHSNGEIAAACVAGRLSLEDGARTVALWSRAQARLAGRGAMAAVPLPPGALTDRITRYEGRVSLAAVNGARSVVLSGERDSLHELTAELVAEGVAAKLIPVDLAAHSPHIDDLHEELMTGLATVSPRLGTVPMRSTTTPGEPPALDAAYWFRNLRNTVQFARATRGLVADGYDIFVEISPHPVLTYGVQETIDAEDADAVVVAGLRRTAPDQVLRALATLHLRGVPVDWDAVFAQWPPPAERAATPPPAPASGDLVDLVTRTVADVLGGEGSADPDRPFRDWGVTSLTALEVRDRLAAETGRKVPVSAVFDYPTPRALAGFLDGRDDGTASRPATVALDDPIAIVSMACRLPGGVDSPEALWELLLANGD